jgi:hypothetical protein
MMKYTSWMISVLASAVLVVTLFRPVAASAATHSGKWDFPPGTSKATPSFGTKNKARTCVTATKINSTNGWKFQLVWYNGGKNTRLYRSPIYRSRSTHCSPTKTMPRNNDKVYDIITAVPTPGSQPYAGGKYTIATN